MDIEKDIEKVKKLNNLLNFFKTHGWIPNMSRETNINETIEAIEHLLAEREEDKKKIEELEDRCKSHQKLLYEAAKVEKNGIPKQKVKEIFDRLHISDIEPWSTYKVSGDILFDLKEILEDKQYDSNS